MISQRKHIRTGMTFLMVCAIIAFFLLLFIRAAMNPLEDATNVQQIVQNDVIQADGTIISEDMPKSFDDIVGKPYPLVRKLLLKEGWQPLDYTAANENGLHHCNPFDNECSGLKEIESCAGSGNGPCNGWWKRRSQFLRITMAEGPKGYVQGHSFQSESDVPMVAREKNAPLLAYVPNDLGVSKAYLIGEWGTDFGRGDACMGADISFYDDGTYGVTDAGGNFKLSSDGRYILTSSNNSSDGEQITQGEDFKLRAYKVGGDRLAIRWDDELAVYRRCA